MLQKGLKTDLLTTLGSGKSPRVSKDAVDDGGNNAKNDVNGNEYVAALVEHLVFPTRHDSGYFTASSFLLSTLDGIADGDGAADYGRDAACDRGLRKDRVVIKLERAFALLAKAAKRSQNRSFDNIVETV